MRSNLGDLARLEHIFDAIVEEVRSQNNNNNNNNNNKHI
jgi:hypothetical protein